MIVAAWIIAAITVMLIPTKRGGYKLIALIVLCLFFEIYIGIYLLLRWWQL